MNNTGVIILSILVPSIPERSDMLDNLLMTLHSQRHELNELHPMLGAVEILFDNSKKYLDGGLSIGAKCNDLLKAASGKYLCFLHDDDIVAPNYVETLMRLCQEDKDVVSFRNFTKTDTYWALVDMSLNNENEELNPFCMRTKRTPWIICPIRSILAKAFEFNDINYGEDAKWIEQVLTKCKTESYTNAILHCYQHSSKTSEADRITKHQTNAI